jgi:hypothetical protein
VGAAVQYYASPQVGRLGLLKAVPSGRKESDLQIFLEWSSKILHKKVYTTSPLDVAGHLPTKVVVNF